MARLLVGLDVGSTTCHAVGVDKKGSLRLDREFDTSEANLVSVFEDVSGESACASR